MVMLSRMSLKITALQGPEAALVRAASGLLHDAARLTNSAELALLAKVVDAALAGESTSVEYDGHALARQMAKRAGEPPPVPLRELYRCAEECDALRREVAALRAQAPGAVTAPTATT